MAHLDSSVLYALLEEAHTKVKVGGTYQHYRSNGEYTVTSLALQEDSEKPCVIYSSTKSPGITWVRNVDDWTALVEKDGQVVPRFQIVE